MQRVARRGLQINDGLTNKSNREFHASGSEFLAKIPLFSMVAENRGE